VVIVPDRTLRNLHKLAAVRAGLHFLSNVTCDHELNIIANHQGLPLIDTLFLRWEWPNLRKSQGEFDSKLWVAPGQGVLAGSAVFTQTPQQKTSLTAGASRGAVCG
jgi:hypothetical protein